MTAALEEPHPRIERVAFVGYGYVGRGTAHALASIAEIAYHDPTLPGSKDLEDVCRWADAIFVCVPTPMGRAGAPDLATVEAVMRRIAAVGTKAPVILKSTVSPGTSARLAERLPGLRLVFSPEFLRERHHLEDATSPARVVIGWTGSIDRPARAAVRALFRRRFRDVPLVELDSTQAELLKYASNALFGVKVSFANEMDELAASLGVEWEPIREALVLDPRVGDGHLTVPGPDGERGYGGSCLPKDMAGLLSVAADHAVALDVVEAAVRGNRRRRPG